MIKKGRRIILLKEDVDNHMNKIAERWQQIDKLYTELRALRKKNHDDERWFRRHCPHLALHVITRHDPSADIDSVCCRDCEVWSCGGLEHFTKDGSQYVPDAKNPDLLHKQ